MKASTERKLLRWLHLVASIPIAGYIYGPVADIPRVDFAVKVIIVPLIVPLVVLSGLWMWQGHRDRKAFSKRKHHE